GAFLLGAEMAFLYERNGFDSERCNWPDWRNMSLGELLRQGRVEELRRAVRAGRAPAYETHFMAAWCHGAPGIGLSRLRAFELTGQGSYLREAEAALRSTRASLVPENVRAGNFSLCHGACGNAELLLHAAEMLGEAELAEGCEEMAAWGREHRELAEGRWPCGTLDGASDPSLLVGEAGIGLFYLRLADPSVPTPLLLRSAEPRPTMDGGPGRPSEARREGFRAEARSELRDVFGGTFERWRRVRPELGEPPLSELLGTEPPAAEPLGTAPQNAAHAWLCERAEGDSRLADAFLPERRAYELTAGIRDLTADRLRRLARPGWEELEVDSVRFHLPAGVELAVTEHDWPAWGGEGKPEAAPTPWLLVLDGYRMRARSLGQLPAVLLECLDAPRTLTGLVAEVAAASAGSGVDSADLSARLVPLVREQLEHLYRAGVVDAG
ncbi:MAG: hypothetical protein MI919_29085, partial [Holophagales bacterium]|nr:hypothetical protein [Holophagales bacterium]